MDEGNGRSPASKSYSLRFIELLDEWAHAHGRLLDGLVELRGYGDEAVEAVNAILAIRTVAKVKTSWTLWELLVEDADDDPDSILLDRLPRHAVEHTRLALFGEPWRRRELRLVER